MNDMFAKVRFCDDVYRTYPSARAAFEAALAGRQTLDCAVFAALCWLSTHLPAEYEREQPTEVHPRSTITDILYRRTSDLAVLAPCEVEAAMAIDVASHAQWLVRVGGEWHGLTQAGVEVHPLAGWLERHADMAREAIDRRLPLDVIRAASRLSGEWVIWQSRRRGQFIGQGQEFNVIYSLPRRRVRTRQTVLGDIARAHRDEVAGQRARDDVVGHAAEDKGQKGDAKDAAKDERVAKRLCTGPGRGQTD